MFCLMKNRLQLLRAFNLGLGTFSPKVTFLSHEIKLLYTESLDFFFHGRESNVALQIINQSLKVKLSYTITSHIFFAHTSENCSELQNENKKVHSFSIILLN